MAKITLVTAPADRLITAADLRAHSRIDDSGEDEYLEQLIDSAVAVAQACTWRRFVTQTWDQSFDGFANPLCLRYPPLVSVTSVTYIDIAGDTQTLSTDIYEVGQVDGLDVVRLKNDQSWPTTQAHADVVTVRTVVGYGDPADVPQDIKHAVRLHAASFYEHREGVILFGSAQSSIPESFYSLLFPYQVQVR